jgi:hypothetical protein
MSIAVGAVDGIHGGGAQQRVPAGREVREVREES